jgi:hypothetical protein
MQDGAPLVEHSIAKNNARLQPLIGEWRLAMVMPGEPRPDPLPDVGARATFEWMGDKAFVLQRWSVPIPEAPKGLAILGWDEGRQTFLQHYFDDRGVARVYEMAFDGGVWRLERTRLDFAPFAFSQRFVGTLSADGSRIDGTWEIAEDHHSWKHDFDLIYCRV